MVPSLKQLPLFDFKHNAEQEAAADTLGMKILANSPYKDNLAEAGLFLKALAKYGRRVPNLVKANLGESLVTDSRISFRAPWPTRRRLWNSRIRSKLSPFRLAAP